MVKPAIFPVLVLGLALLAAPALPARELADYHPGDTVENDIVTPVPLDVIDAAATAARREQESLKTPAIFRYYTGTTNEVQSRFVSAFASVRARFRAEAARAFHPIPLDEPTRLSPAFSEFISAFNRQAELLPVTPDLAQVWASGDDGLAIQTTLVSRLLQNMRRHIRGDDASTNSNFGDTLRLVAVAGPDEPLTLETATQRGRIVTRTSVATLSRARTLLRRDFPDNEQALARAVAAFLKPDCALDEPLTQLARDKQIEQLVVADHFDADQVIARRGQVIDLKLKAAMDQLHDKMAVGQLSEQIVVEQGLNRQVRERNRWLLAALIGVSLGAGWGIWQLSRRRQPVSLLPALARSAAGGLSVADDSWRQRALDAESRVEKVQAIIRANLEPQLAQTLKEALVQGLASQRAELLETQQRAAQEINELVHRLDQLQTPMQERLRTYEQRIEDLEKALTARNEEYRELLKLKIEMTRRQAETERASSSWS